MRGEVPFLESIEQFGLVGFLILLLASGAIAACLDGTFKLLVAAIKRRRTGEHALRMLIAGAAAGILLVWVTNMIEEKRADLHKAAQLLDGKWKVGGDCKFTMDLTVNVKSKMLFARLLDGFTMIYEIDYILPNSVQVHAPGGDTSLFERSGNTLVHRDIADRKVSYTRC